MRLFRFTNNDGTHWIAAADINEALRRAVDKTRRDGSAGRFCPIVVQDKETEETLQAIVDMPEFPPVNKPAPCPACTPASTVTS